MIQTDTVAFRDVFAITAINIFSEESAVLLRPAFLATDEQAFLHNCVPGCFDGHVEIIQTDGGAEFKGSFAQDVLLYCNCHLLARPHKKNEKAFIESFNRSLQKECLG